MTGDTALDETLRLFVALPFAVGLLWAASVFPRVGGALKAAIALAWAAATLGLAAWSMTLPVSGAWNQVGTLFAALVVAVSWVYLGGRVLLREALRELFPTRST